MIGAVIASGEYGVVSKPNNHQNVSCLICKGSKRCSHVKHFESNNEKEQIAIPQNQSPFDEFDPVGNPINIEESEEDIDLLVGSNPVKLEYPITQEKQKVFREGVVNNFTETDLIPGHDSIEVCGHGFHFDPRCPKQEGFIQSNIVKYWDTEYSPQLNRTAYYRPTLGNCCCLKVWTGEMVLNVSRAKGKTVHLVSYRKLHTFQWLFSKAGVTRRGYHKAEANRHRDQYGAREEEIIPWWIFNLAVNFYQNKVLKPDEKICSTCPDCGPKPDFLCCDGVMPTLPMKRLHGQTTDDLYLPMRSNEILDNPKYAERMIIKD